jgi:Gnt-I system high-affinity gluconate transporter
MATTVLPMVAHFNEGGQHLLDFLSNPSIILLVAIAFATYMIGIRCGMRMKRIMRIYEESVKDVAMILLIVGGAGALKEVFAASGVSREIAGQLQNWSIHPLVLGWLMAAIIRVCLGSATVAGLTAASLILPLIVKLHVNPNLMVLSVGAGSLFFSHVNDSGFWMFKEYFNLSIRDTIRSWSVMESIVSVVGLIGVLILNVLIR